MGSLLGVVPMQVRRKIAVDMEYNRKTKSTKEASRNIAENYDEESTKGALPKDVETDERKERKIRVMVREEHITTLRRHERLEQNYARPMLRTHYKNRYAWIRKKSDERQRKELPREIDGVIMEDLVLGERFEPRYDNMGE